MESPLRTAGWLLPALQHWTVQTTVLTFFTRLTFTCLKLTGLLFWLCVHRYVGVCSGLKVAAGLLFFLDWLLICWRHKKESDKPPALTVGEIVSSIISLDRLSVFGWNTDIREDDEEQPLGPDSGIHLKRLEIQWLSALFWFKKITTALTIWTNRTSTIGMKSSLIWPAKKVIVMECPEFRHIYNFYTKEEKKQIFI